MTAALQNLLASRFIARPEVKARQFDNGAYSPVLDENEHHVGFGRTDLAAHLSGEQTYGHYLLSTSSTCKLFCLDVDLKGDSKGDVNKAGILPTGGYADDEPYYDFQVEHDVRSVWKDRADPRRNYIKYCMRLGAHQLASAIFTNLEIPTAVAYSGNKGYHVYGFTGPISALDAREAAEIVLESVGGFIPILGKSTYGVADPWSEEENPFYNFSVEVYPKQEQLNPGQLGNLLRLPLGRNRKSPDPTFFMDMTTPLTVMKPVDPEWALTTDNPWKRPGE